MAPGATGRIAFSGAGTKQLSADNSIFIGGITLASGKLILGHQSALGTNQFFWNGGAREADGTFTDVNAVATLISLGGDVAVSGTNDLEFSNTFSLFSGNTTNKTLVINNPNTIIRG